MVKKTAAEGADWVRMNKYEYEMSTQKLCDIIKEFSSRHRMDDDVEHMLSEQYHVAFSAWLVSGEELVNFLDSGKAKNPSAVVRKRIELLVREDKGGRYRDKYLSASYLSGLIQEACDRVRNGTGKKSDESRLEDIDEYLWNSIAPKYVHEAVECMRALDYRSCRDPVSLTFSKWRPIQRLRGAGPLRRKSSGRARSRSRTRSRSRSRGRRGSKSSDIPWYEKGPTPEERARAKVLAKNGGSKGGSKDFDMGSMSWNDIVNSFRDFVSKYGVDDDLKHSMWSGISYADASVVLNRKMKNRQTAASFQKFLAKEVRACREPKPKVGYPSFSQVEKMLEDTATYFDKHEIASARVMDVLETQVPAAALQDMLGKKNNLFGGLTDPQIKSRTGVAVSRVDKAIKEYVSNHGGLRERPHHRAEDDASGRRRDSRDRSRGRKNDSRRENPLGAG